MEVSPAVSIRRAKKPASPVPATGAAALLVATRKGTFILKADAARGAWTIAGPMFFGHVVHHVVLDPRERRTLLARSMSR